MEPKWMDLNNPNSLESIGWKWKLDKSRKTIN